MAGLGLNGRTVVFCVLILSFAVSFCDSLQRRVGSRVRVRVVRYSGSRYNTAHVGPQVPVYRYSGSRSNNGNSSSSGYSTGGSRSDLSVGQIVGIVIGSIVGLIVIVSIIICACRKACNCCYDSDSSEKSSNDSNR